MTAAEVRERLLSMAEPGYRDFSIGLLPGVENLLGVRIPALRRLARGLAREDWRGLLEHPMPEPYFEETMLRGFLIAYGDMPLDERFARIGDFVPEINNWSVCDSFCASLKQARKHPEAFFDFVLPYCGGELEYYARFGVVMLLNHFIDEAHIDRVLETLVGVRQPDYYARMAVAWAIAECAARFPERTLPWFEQAHIDPDTRRKAERKMRESKKCKAHNA